MKYFKRVCFIFLFILFFCSCSADLGQPISPTGYNNLLLKARDFVFISNLILTHTSNSYGQVISRIYYSYYTLARLVSINRNEGYDNSTHRTIFPKNDGNPLNRFGFLLKQKRYNYDYDADINSYDFHTQISDLEYILRNRNLFEEQIILIQDTLSDNLMFTSVDEDEKVEELLLEYKKELNDFMMKLDDVTNRTES